MDSPQADSRAAQPGFFLVFLQTFLFWIRLTSKGLPVSCGGRIRTYNIRAPCAIEKIAVTVLFKTTSVTRVCHSATPQWTTFIMQKIENCPQYLWNWLRIRLSCGVVSRAGFEPACHIGRRILSPSHMLRYKFLAKPSLEGFLCVFPFRHLPIYF